MTTSSNEKKLTQKELNSIFWRTFTTSHAWHFERQQHMAFAFAMIPTIKKLYDNREDRIAAYKRHLEFYNCQTTMQPLIAGISVCGTGCSSTCCSSLSSSSRIFSSSISI